MLSWCILIVLKVLTMESFQNSFDVHDNANLSGNIVSVLQAGTDPDSRALSLQLIVFGRLLLRRHELLLPERHVREEDVSHPCRRDLPDRQYRADDLRPRSWP